MYDCICIQRCKQQMYLPELQRKKHKENKKKYFCNKSPLLGNVIKKLNEINALMQTLGEVNNFSKHYQKSSVLFLFRIGIFHQLHHHLLFSKYSLLKNFNLSCRQIPRILSKMLQKIAIRIPS